MTNLASASAPTHLVMPVLHIFATYVVSAKILTQLNEPRAKCTTLPLIPTWPKITIYYAKLLTLPNLMCLLPQQVSNLICHHVTIVILTLLTMLTTVNAPHANAAAPLASCTVFLAVVTAILMIIAITSNHHSSHYVGHHDFLPPAKCRAIAIGDCATGGYASIASEVLFHYCLQHHPGRKSLLPVSFWQLQHLLLTNYWSRLCIWQNILPW